MYCLKVREGDVFALRDGVLMEEGELGYRIAFSHEKDVKEGFVNIFIRTVHELNL